MPFVTIDDASDARLDEYRNIPDGDLAARRGIFVAEGRFVVRRLLADSPLVTRSVMVTEPARAALDDVLSRRPDVTVYVVAPEVVHRVTGVNIHRGCLAIGVRPDVRAFRLPFDVAQGTPSVSRGLKPDAASLVVLERVANADNVGGVFRNAAAFGVDAVLLDPVSTDPLYRKAIRTSMGAALHVPFARLEPWPDALRDLRARGWVLLAMTPATGAQPLDQCVARAIGHPVAIVVGHEGEGLTRDALDLCDLRARIPMASGVDSLNVATAAGIALYELARHKGAP